MAEKEQAFLEAENRIQEALQNNYQTLDLSSLKLQEVPESLGELSSLQRLWLNYNQLSKVPEFLGQLSSLQRLYLSNNQLSEVPDSLGQLSSLQQLNLSNNHLSEVPEALGQLSSLQRLYLSNNQMSDVPDSLGQLSSLQRLYLSKNQLNEVPGSIGQLSSLQTLYLDYNQLNEVPESLGQLGSLQTLSLSNNQLSEVPGSIGQLGSLHELSLSNNQLSEVPDSLGQLGSLQRLYLDYNQLSEVPDSLGQLGSLRELSLSNNQLSKVPGSLGQLGFLQGLYLHGNQLSEVPEALGQLRSLQLLYLHDNEKLQIPPEILGASWKGVGIEGTETANPQDILNYYFSSTNRNSHSLNEAKLILVGFGAVGKTSLVNRLVYGEFDPIEPKTDGINITQWPIQINPDEDIRLNIWDFGGQEIMHSTHQFFLTERSLYLLVLNGRQGHEDEDAEYWLNLIKSFGKDSPVIIVLNKFSETAFDLNRSYLRQKFPNICDFIETDCGDGDGQHPDGRNIDKLKKLIRTETDQLENLRLPFPDSWFKVKNYLSEMSENYITFERFRQLCQESGEPEIGKQNSLANILHQLGISLNYREDHRLRETQILNPQWITKGIYTIINDESLTNCKGDLALNKLDEILDRDEYPADRHSFLLELMQKNSNSPFVSTKLKPAILLLIYSINNNHLKPNPLISKPVSTFNTNTPPSFPKASSPASSPAPIPSVLIPMPAGAPESS